MTFEQIYSGSSGNLYIVTANDGKRLIIDMGVSWKKFVKALDYNLSNTVVGALANHSHSDHTKCIKDVMKAGIEVFASPETFEALGIVGERRAIPLPPRLWYRRGDFNFMGYESNHDVPGSYLFVVQCDDEFLLFATDCSHITQQFKLPFSIIAIECSYDKDILQQRVESGEIHEEVAKRLLTSHMEKSETMRYLDKFCDLSRCRSIHLLHMSRENIIAEDVRREIEKEFFIKTYICP